MVSIAQETGTIVGSLTDKENNNEPLPFANVIVKGTNKGTTSDFDGNFEITNVPVGTYTLEVSFVGYETVEIPNVTVEANKFTTINTGLGASAAALEEVLIKVETSREKESALLLEQKKAVEIKQSIGAQELARKGVSDVSGAVTKTTGISKQEGGGDIYVRGLGDRYNATTLNGLPLPSNNPNNKNISLDIFSTDIVQSIGIDKTYVYSNYGDFAGANIDIVSKDYTGKGFISLSVGSGINSEATGVSQFYLQDGPDFSGFYNIDIPNNILVENNFETSWDRNEAPTPINNSFSIKGGDSFSITDNAKINFFAVGAFDNDYGFREGVARGNVTLGGINRRDFDYQTFQYNTNTTLMGNFGLKKEKNKFQFNTLYINSTSQNQREFFGVVDAFDYAPEGGAFVQRSEFERTELVVNQLLGEHKATERLQIDWAGSHNFVRNSIPDRRQIILTPDDWDIPEGPKSFDRTLNQSDNHRYFHDLLEEEFAGNIEAAYSFDKNEEEEFNGKIRAGFNGRYKRTDFEATQVNYQIIQRNQDNSVIDQPIIDDIYNLDAYFNQENFNSLYRLRTFRGGVEDQNALDPQTYDGQQSIIAGFAGVEYQFSEKLSAIAALRLEQIEQRIEWSTALQTNGGPSSFNRLEFLPTLSSRYALTEKQNLRLAASKTYTLPQFKERALFQYEDVVVTTFGNPSLRPSTDYNLDLKWELFPSSEELISVTGYGKLIQDPINQITVNSATNDITWVNSGDQAIVLGGELEVRKSIFSKEREVADNTLKKTLTTGFNASYLHSNQDLDAEKVNSETTAGGFPLSVDFSDDESEITGASTWLVNADVSFFNQFSERTDIQATLSYNFFSDRVFSLGTEGRGNLVDKGVHTLDFTVKSNLNQNFTLAFNAKNLLNPTVERELEFPQVTVLSFKRGVDLGLSLTYNF
ncbi:TonB-dependent receptor [Gangjinia marincola]|uniref:TonB-dependent receptor n=1 Tax=Gangjinia marincola TaxID=578463 RepID=A0ABN1MHM1_9FLAO